MSQAKFEMKMPLNLRHEKHDFSFTTKKGLISTYTFFFQFTHPPLCDFFFTFGQPHTCFNLICSILKTICLPGSLVNHLKLNKKSNQTRHTTKRFPTFMAHKKWAKPSRLKCISGIDATWTQKEFAKWSRKNRVEGRDCQNQFWTKPITPDSHFRAVKTKSI